MADTEVSDPGLAANNPSLTLPPQLSSNNQDAGVRFRSQTTQTTDTSSTMSRKDGQAVDNEHMTSMPSKYERGWRRIVRNFSPSWFSVTMGTGVVALLLEAIPFQSNWLHYLSIIFFILNLILYSLAFVTSFLRYTLYPEIWGVMIQDPINSLFLGTIPIGFATLVEMWIFICVPIWGNWTRLFVFVAWIIDSAASITVTFMVTIIRITDRDESHLSALTAVQLLPIAATIVASGLGSETSEILGTSYPNIARGTLLASYVMWSFSMLMAMNVLVIYYQRLTIHKIPPREVIVSCFLPLGPLGMGGYTILYLGKTSVKILPQPSNSTSYSTPSLNPTLLYTIGLLLSLLLWSYALPWFAFALGSIWSCRYPNNKSRLKRPSFPFNMGWWGFTFPMGVWALCTIELGEDLGSIFFKVLGTIFAIAVIILWIVVAIGTIRGAVSGELFYAPCLANLKDSDEGRNGKPSHQRPPG